MPLSHCEESDSVNHENDLLCNIVLFTSFRTLPTDLIMIIYG